MGVDSTSVKTFLAVNGLSPESPREEIQKALAQGNYTPEEITTALALLSQPDAPRPSNITITHGGVSTVPVSMKASSYPVVAPTVVERASLTFIERLLGWGVVLFLLGGFVLLAHQVSVPLLFFFKTYQTSPETLTSFMVLAVGAFMGALVFLFFAWRLARLFYGTRSYTLWLSLVLGLYALMWFALVELLVPYLGSTPTLPDWASFMTLLLIPALITFINASVILSALFAVFLSLFYWNTSGKGEGSGASLMIGVSAVAVLIYATNALLYPATYFHVNVLCYGIAGEVEQSICLTESMLSPLEEEQIPGDSS
ncbi:MAG: hypothetical protein WBK28_00935 [Minisyncoccia bacterium]